jgi:hypothetical protein
VFSHRVAIVAAGAGWKGELQGKDVSLNGSFFRRKGRSDIVLKGNTAIGPHGCILNGLRSDGPYGAAFSIAPISRFATKGLCK